MENRTSARAAFFAAFCTALVSLIIGVLIVRFAGGHDTAAGVHLGPDWDTDMPRIYLISGLIGLFVWVGMWLGLLEFLGAIAEGLADLF
jgi:hypothetical protein